MNYTNFIELYEAFCLEQLRLEPKERGMRAWFDQQKSVIDEMRHFAKSKTFQSAIAAQAKEAK